MGRRRVGTGGRGRGLGRPSVERPEIVVVGDRSARRGAGEAEDKDQKNVDNLAPSSHENGGRKPPLNLVHYGSDSEDDGGKSTKFDARQKIRTYRNEGLKGVGAGDWDKERYGVGESPPLPLDWQQCKDSEGEVYYWNTATGVTSWKRPETSGSSALSVGTTPVENSSTLNGIVVTKETRDKESDVDREGKEGVSTKVKTNVAGFNPPVLSGRSSISEGDNVVEGDELSSMLAGIEQEMMQSENETSGEGGVDDLLANIEEEMRSGGEGGIDSAYNGLAMGPDFSSLGEVSLGLDKVAREAFNDIQESLRMDERGESSDGHELDRNDKGEGIESWGPIEMLAVLRARLSDWKQGGLDGSFFVTKLQEMATAARSLHHPVVEKSAPDTRLCAGSDTETSPKLVSISRGKTPTAGGGKGVKSGPRERSVGIESLNGTRIPMTTTTISSSSSVYESSSAGNIRQTEESKIHEGGKNRRKANKVKGNEGMVALAWGVGLQDTRGSSVVVEPVNVTAALEEERIETEVKDAAAKVEAEQDTTEVEGGPEKVTEPAATGVVREGEGCSCEEKEHGEVKMEMENGKETGADGGGDKGDQSKHDSNTSLLVTERALPDLGKGTVAEARGAGHLKARVRATPVRWMNDEVDNEKDSEAKAVERDSAVEEGEIPAEIAVSIETPLPSGWAAVWSEPHGAFYYHNLATDETTWDRPDLSLSTGPGTASTGVAAAAAAGVKSVLTAESEGAAGGDDGTSTSVGSTPSAFRTNESVMDISGGGEEEAWSTEESGTAKVAAMMYQIPRCARAHLSLAWGEKSQVRKKYLEFSPWVSVWDEGRHAYYYHNTATDETLWELPQQVPTPTSTPAEASASASMIPTAQDTTDAPKTTEAAVSPSSPPPLPEGDPPPPLPDEQAHSLSLLTSDRAKVTVAAEPTATTGPAALAIAAGGGSSIAEEERPSTLVWWSDVGDVWGGGALAGLLAGLGQRKCRNLGGGYYMTTLSLGPDWATTAVARLGEGPDPVVEARSGWVASNASTPGYGLFLRWAGADDEQELFNVPAEVFNDDLSPPLPDAPLPPLPKGGGAVGGAEATATKIVGVGVGRGQESQPASVQHNGDAEAMPLEVVASGDSQFPGVATVATKKRKGSGKEKRAVGGGGGSAGPLGKKSKKGARSLIDKWKAVASEAGEESQKEAERLEKMERWRAKASQDPDNTNFAPIGRRRKL